MKTTIQSKLDPVISFFDERMIDVLSVFFSSWIIGKYESHLCPVPS
jgi:hypothetical protein